MAEGIHLHTAWGPRRFLGDGRLSGVEFVACTQVFDAEGRFRPEFDESKTLEMSADSVIVAIGQQADLSFVKDDDGIELTRGGTIRIDPETLATTAPGVFAGGDVAFGPRIAIEAVANGKRAAHSIDEFLGGGPQETAYEVSVERVPPRDYVMAAGYELRDRSLPNTVELGRRTGITEVEEVFSESQARAQAERCLVCHVDTVYDPLKCVLCGRCADVCPNRCLVFAPVERVDLPEEQRRKAVEACGHEADAPLTVLLKDDTACIRCGLCAERCPTEAMTMERFNFVESSQ